MRRKKVVICRCEEVTDDEILDAVKRGAKTVAEIKKMTRAGMGICQGKTCGMVVARILSKTTGKKLEEIMPDTSRTPLRPIKLSDLAGGNAESES